jgi:hypothetical protein
MTEEILQVFEGYIDWIDEETGHATVRLFDRTVETNPEEEAVIDFSNVSTNLKEVEPGHIFQWRIGHRLAPDGTVSETINEFVFQRYTEEDIKRIEDSRAEAHALAERLVSLMH